MKAFFKLLSLIRHYKPWVAGHVISNILTAVFTVLTIPVIIPIFQLFFSPEELNRELTQPTFSISNLNEYINYELLQWLQNEPSKESALIKACVFLVSLFFLKNVFTYLSLYFIAPVRNGIIRDLRAQLYEKLTELPLSFYTEERRGDLLSRFSSDTIEIEWSILSTLEKLVRDPLTIIGTLTFMLVISVKLTLFVIVMLTITGIVISSIARQLKRQSSDVQSRLGRIMSIVEETLSGMKVIKAFHAGKTMQKKFNAENNAYRRSHTRMMWRA